MTNYEIRAKARQDLGSQIFSNQWMIALVVCLLASVLSSLAASVVPILGALLITGPLMAGMASFFLAYARKDSDAKIETLFNGFYDFGQTFLIGLMMSLFTFLWSLLFVIPGIVKSYAYSMAYYIKKDNPSYSWQECMDESQRMMQGKKWQLFCLDLSFIGWLVLGALCLGVGTLWVAPYMESARANFYASMAEGLASSSEPAFEQKSAEFQSTNTFEEF